MTEFMLQHSAPVSTMKKLGGVLLIAGTSIGAGMLAIPYAVAAAGFFYAVILLLVNWLIMLPTALLMVEVNTRQPIAADLNTNLRISGNHFWRNQTLFNDKLFLFTPTLYSQKKVHIPQ